MKKEDLKISFGRNEINVHICSPKYGEVAQMLRAQDSYPPAGGRVLNFGI